MPFVHELGLCESTRVGEGTRIWAFAHVLPGAVIGEEVNVCDYVFIENDVVVGDRVTIKCGVQLWDGIRLADDVFIGPNVTFTNDAFPRSKHYPASFATTVVERGASIGGGAVILPGVRIGTGAMVGAGSVVTSDVPAHAVVVGNPATIVRYVEDQRPEPPAVPAVTEAAGPTLARDMRGSLMALELESQLPFVPRRFFCVYGVPSRKVRGQHAHRQCHQYLVALAGSVTCLVDDGVSRRTVTLDDPGTGLHIPPMTWGTQYDYSPDAVLAVFASHPYDADDYIRDYQEFVSVAEGSTGV
jgi:UDP-2-acetamido-3-amino-2,3-dideoxy-glucuronate N-acetyltransferase